MLCRVNFYVNVLRSFGQVECQLCGCTLFVCTDIYFIYLFSFTFAATISGEVKIVIEYT